MKWLMDNIQKSDDGGWATKNPISGWLGWKMLRLHSIKCLGTFSDTVEWDVDQDVRLNPAKVIKRIKKDCSKMQADWRFPIYWAIGWSPDSVGFIFWSKIAGVSKINDGLDFLWGHRMIDYADENELAVTMRLFAYRYEPSNSPIQ